MSFVIMNMKKRLIMHVFTTISKYILLFIIRNGILHRK